MVWLAFLYWGGFETAIFMTISEVQGPLSPWSLPRVYYFKQQCLYFLPLPHGHGLFR